MNENIKKMFDQVHAEPELRSKTADYIFQKTNGYTRARFAYRKQLVAALCSFAILIIGGRWLYFTPTVEISIDINPSIELGVNRFDRVVSCEGYNTDGDALLDSLNLTQMRYADAVTCIMENDQVQSLLSEDEVMTISVVGSDRTQSKKILSNLESCTSKEENTYCYYAHTEEVHRAHDVGLSYGKYRAFLELKELMPELTESDVHHMTMREILDLIESLSGETTENPRDSGAPSGNAYGTSSGNGSGSSQNGTSSVNGHHGNGSGHRNGHH